MKKLEKEKRKEKRKKKKHEESYEMLPKADAQLVFHL